MTATRTHLGITYTDDGGRRVHRGPGPKRELCIMACVFCRDHDFGRWLRDEHKAIINNDDDAKEVLLNLVGGVKSRNELDTDQAAGARFLELVRKPFMAWKEAQSVNHPSN